LGDADEIVKYLCGRLGKGWTLPPPLAEEEDPQSKSKEGQSLSGPSKVAGAAVGEPPSLKNKSSARSISSGGASANTSSSATNKAKGKAEDKIQGADAPTAEPTRIGARYVVFLFLCGSGAEKRAVMGDRNHGRITPFLRREDELKDGKTLEAALPLPRIQPGLQPEFQLDWIGQGKMDRA